MKIIYVAPYASEPFLWFHGDTQTGGLAAQRKIELICEALSDQGHEVQILSSIIIKGRHRFWRPPYRETVQCGPYSIPVRYPGTLQVRPFGTLLNAFRARHIVQKVLKDYAPDLVFLYNTTLFEALAALAFTRKTQPGVVVEVEDLPFARKRDWGNVKPWLDHLCWRRILRLAKGFTAVNATIMSLLPANKPAKLLPGIIDERLIANTEKRIPPFGRTRMTLGYFGGLTDDKGVTVLLDILDDLPEPWDILVCGGGSLSPLFKSAAEASHGRMKFMGSVDASELYKHMSSCDCTLVPAEKISGDGTGVFPFKIFEYLVAGTHIIAPPLLSLEYFGLNFIQRWDGGKTTLCNLLQNAEHDYKKETDQRLLAVKLVTEHYRVAGVSNLLRELLAEAKMSEE